MFISFRGICMISYKVFIGNEGAHLIGIVSDMRITYFREFPYMYKGNLEYEKEYISELTSHKKSMIVTASINSKIVGISTALPLTSDADILKEVYNLFEKKSYAPKEIYYYGEVIVLPSYRRKGIANQLYHLHEQQALKWKYKYACLAVVVRDKDDPRKPNQYLSTDIIWPKLGFKKENIYFNYHWPTVLSDGQVKDVQNTMVFWTKKIG